MLDSGLINRVSQLKPTQSPDGSRIILSDPPSPKQKWVLTPESFDGMLSWLNHDRDQAGKKYEEIRQALIKRFRQLGCHDAEQLTNETFDRVARKLPEIVEKYIGKRELYFFSIAHYVYKEHLRKPIVMSLPNTNFPHPNLPNAKEVFEKEVLDICLRHCIERLKQPSRDLITNYYRGERNDKVIMRRQLAERLGIKLENLRLKAQRVRATLKKCILDCMERKAASETLI